MRRLRKPVDLTKFPELFEVLTAAATADHIGVHRDTVLNAINDGRVAAVQVGGIWLVAKRSAESLWWKPGTRRKIQRKCGSNVA